MIFHDVEQGTDEWLDLRMGKATASNYSTIMANAGGAFGDPAKRYALKLALERVTGRRAEYSFKNDDMERGNLMEPAARALYEARYFTDVANGGFFDWGDWGDSPDGLVFNDGTLEVKSVIASVHEANIRRGAIDPAYKWQVAGHIQDTGRDWCDFGSYCSDYPEGKQLVVYRTHRKDIDDMLDALVERRAKFIDLVNQKVEEINQLEAA